jgi:sensor histidine kinase YesM
VGVNPNTFSRKFGAIVDNAIEAGVSVEKLPGRVKVCSAGRGLERTGG